MIVSDGFIQIRVIVTPGSKAENTLDGISVQLRAFHTHKLLSHMKPVNVSGKNNTG